MTAERHSPEHGPTPEQLTAYVDGELSEPECARVETWLTDHPDALAETDAWRRLDDLCRATAAPEPSPDAWAAVLDRVAAGRPASSRPGSSPRKWPWLRLGLGLGAAAAAALTLLLSRSVAQSPPPSLEPLPVVSRNDVVLIKVDGEDTALIAAPAPVDEVGPLVEEGEIHFPDQARPEPADLMQVQGAKPMVIDPWATLARGP